MRLNAAWKSLKKSEFYEAYNQMLKTSFLISQYTYEFVKDYVDTVKLSSVNIKGKSKPIDIYEVLKIKNE